MFDQNKAFDLPRIAGNVFIGFGAFVSLVGVLIVFDDPTGFFAILFGLAFVGIGFLARRFAVPKDMQALTVSEHAMDVRTWDGRRGTLTESTVIHVGKNAGEAEKLLARETWMREQWSGRPDWVEGLILSDDARYGTLAYWAAGLWTAFALGALIAALIWGEIAWFVLAGALPFAAAFVVGAVRLALRRRKYSASRFALAQTPVAIGGRLEGEVSTGVPKNVRLPEGFKLTLRCVHRWEEQSGSGNKRETRVRRETLWETQWVRQGRTTFESPTLVVPVNCELPADQPPASVGRGSDGFLWELSVTAAFPGIDYLATFELPVFDAQTATVLRRAHAGS